MKIILRFCTTILLSAVGLKSFAQSVQTTPTFRLEQISTARVAVPPFHSLGQAECDGLGNVYYLVVQDDSSPRLILRISSDGGEGKPFFLPSDTDARHVWKLYVAPDGTVYVLSANYPLDKTPETNTLIKLSSSGEVISRTVLAMPLHFGTIAFAVQSNGSSMIEGSIAFDATTANPEPADNRYTVWLNPAGQIIRQVGLEVSEKREIYMTEANNIAMTVGTPGTYLDMAGDKVEVYDTSGVLLRSIPVVKPQKDASVFSLQYVDGQIAIPWSSLIATEPVADASGRVPQQRPHHGRVGAASLTWLLTDVHSDHAYGFFKAPDENKSALCYLGRQHFLYQGGGDGHMDFIEMRPR
jgi:hypothetical protein